MNGRSGIWTRRRLLKSAGGGLGWLAFTSLLGRSGLLADDAVSPMAPRAPHFAARTKSVIWLFINGGPSHVDTWEHKPALARHEGQALPGFDKHTGFFADQVGGLMPSPFRFRQRGECGKWVSEIFPYLGEHVDKMAFLHGGHTESNNHSPALFMMNCGLPRLGYPCAGSWVTYGLGSESDDLPAFVVMSDPKGRGLPKGYALNWSAGFLPSVYQGTWLKPDGDPIENLERPDAMTDGAQRAQLDLLAALNEEHQADQGQESELAARIESFELAYRMQSAAPEALAIEREPESVKRLYGLDDPRCAHFARQCLTARRMIERGVRFVQIYSGGMENQRSWDGHQDIAGNHGGFALETDQPIAGLLADLEGRGLLDETLVVWGGEFGRLPIAQVSDKPGRDHNPHAFTYWLAGGGVKGGVTHGASDELGFRAEVDRFHVNDLHATLLHLLGLDHERLTYVHNGRRFRLTDVAGNVIHDVIA
ncbi:MAG: DUF1501 domain-containing protein [Planctomycetota bacterium]